MEPQMFTGLVEELGNVVAVDADGTAAKKLTIDSSTVSQDVQLGASIAINGCCLTVVEIAGSQLAFQAGDETLSRTNLGQLKPGDSVNLERSLQAGDRLGGHFVTGHVDGLGVLADRQEEGEWCNVRVEVSAELTRQMASKGSVAVDGISLTLVDVGENFFTIALIPHTLAVTTLGDRKIGDSLNIETDVLAKYVQQQLARQT